MSLSNQFLGLFLALLALQLGLSMELPQVTWIGIGLCLLGGLRLVKVERPTWGLLFVLFATGGFLGSQVLEDWAVEGSWAQTNGLGAGIVLSMLTHLLWLYAASNSNRGNTEETVLNRDTQTILVFGLLLTLMLSPPESTVIILFGVPVALLSVSGILLACLVLLADRCAGVLLSRLLLLLPLVLIVPLTVALLGYGQDPIISALGNMFPRSSNYNPTGFSPYQQLRATAFLRPSTRAVMRVTADQQPNQYLVGNRLVHLDEQLVWQPSARPLQTLNSFDAEILPSGEWRYPLDNHHANIGNPDSQTLTINSLSNANYVFVNPGSGHLTGRFSGIGRNAADVLTPVYERGADRRWQLETGGSPVPDTISNENLLMPAFWDDTLQQKSQEFQGGEVQQTVDNVLSHFVTRRYSLQTDFDPNQPFHDFYLNDKAAYCFWFATAATLALRANGIPSRLVGGYVIHERLASELWLVRERDAHSWVEWQDSQGYWHTIDPTPPSITAFFGGYDSSTLSVWYHTLAGQWQILVDRILADELTANLVRYGGLLILAFLFIREYRRIRGQQTKLDTRSQRWQKLWQRFLNISKLPAHSSWTVSTYAENLPTTWPANQSIAVREFLQNYNVKRFSVNDEQAIKDVEDELEKCLKILGEQV